MSTQILYAPLEAAAIGSASLYVRETRDELLAYDKDELAALRFSIILTARWEASDLEDPEHRAELRADLTLLRKHYGDKIDEIAMTFGIDEAMKTKEVVERTVTVPRDMKPPDWPSEELESEDEETLGGDFEV
jgi:hypothetical protein